MKQLLSFFLISLYVIVSSCKKEVFRTRIDGTLVGLTEGQPIADADVYMYGSKSAGFLNGNFTTKELTTKTDKDGKFSFSLKKESGYEYKIYVRKKDYFDEQTTLGVQSYVYLPNTLSKPFKTKVKLYLHEPSYVNIIARNKSNIDSKYSILFDDLNNGKENLSFKCLSTDQVFKRLIVPSNREFVDNYIIIDNQFNKLNSGKIDLSYLKPFVENDILFEY